MKTRRVQINRQQKHILLLALYLLKHQHGKNRPEKRNVIHFIDFKHLIAIRDEDRETVATGEEAWANSIAWRREDLKEEGCLVMPAHGEWQITSLGETRVLEWCAIMDHFATCNPDWENRLDAFESIFGESVVITKDTVLAAQQAYDLARKRSSAALPTVPADVAARIQL